MSDQIKIESKLSISFNSPPRIPLSELRSQPLLQRPLHAHGLALPHNLSLESALAQGGGLRPEPLDLGARALAEAAAQLDLRDVELLERDEPSEFVVGVRLLDGCDFGVALGELVLDGVDGWLEGHVG